jgi:hypothetical protein
MIWSQQAASDDDRNRAGDRLGVRRKKEDRPVVVTCSPLGDSIGDLFAGRGRRHISEIPETDRLVLSV